MALAPSARTTRSVVNGRRHSEPCRPRTPARASPAAEPPSGGSDRMLNDEALFLLSAPLGHRPHRWDRSGHLRPCPCDHGPDASRRPPRRTSSSEVAPGFTTAIYAVLPYASW